MTEPAHWIKAQEFAAAKNEPLRDVVAKIESGQYCGRQVGRHWFVNLSEFSNRSKPEPEPTVTLSIEPDPNPAPNSALALALDADPAPRVSVVAVDMPFWSMVSFLFKLAIAALPAILVLYLLGILFGALAGAT